MIAAIDWVVQHRHDNGLNIRVINLSYGTNSSPGATRSTRSPTPPSRPGSTASSSSPPAGNTGYQSRRQCPGSPTPPTTRYVIAAGGSDSMGTRSLTDDTRRRLLGRRDALRPLQEPRLRRARLAPPGPARAGLVHRPEPPRGRDRQPLLPRHRHLARRRRSSPARRAHPPEVPDADARPGQGFLDGQRRADHRVEPGQGAGEIHLATLALATEPPCEHAQTFTIGDGTGSLELARGSDHLTRDGVVLSGEQDIFGKPFDSAAMARPKRPATELVGRPLERQHLDRQQLVGQQLERHRLERQQLVGLELERHLVRQQLVGLQLER